MSLLLYMKKILSSVFDGDIECTELVLRIILNNSDIKVREVRTQREIKNLWGHSVRLDIEAKDADGKPIDIEVQRAGKGASVKRARYNSSLMDANTLMPGEDYDRLPESYVIFITANDVLGAGLAVCHAEGVEAMCQIMEDLIADEKKEMIIKMKASGKLSNEEIAGITGFTVEQVEIVTKESGFSALQFTRQPS